MSEVDEAELDELQVPLFDLFMRFENAFTRMAIDRVDRQMPMGTR